ncbi:MAG: methyltransferase domain-containing protein [Acidobacteria bacterium]|nr:methyltransferase domain-containing protein [Acidobacteriota bacterium]
MLRKTLDLLRCPYCGTRLAVVDNTARAGAESWIESGVLGCECCAFPIVAGIPVLIADDPTRDAMHALEAGHADDALHLLLGLDEPRRKEFRRLTARPRLPTYRDLLAVLCRDAEADCFLYRLSDPTYLTIEALLDALAQDAPAASGRALDLCGGSGHLTRVLLRAPSRRGVVLADLHFWKLWLAARVTAPGCAPVCCDANSPLPFADAVFSTVLLSDAFPYIWHKRMLAGEMARAATPDGVVVLPHLHSSQGENVNAGDTLTPAAYRDLFARLEPRLFEDGALFEDMLAARAVDLTRSRRPGDLAGAPSLTLVAGRRAELFRRYHVPDRLDVSDALIVNPLYRAEPAESGTRLTLRFPTPEYEAEFGEVKRYLPSTITVPADLRGPLAAADFGPDYADLRRRRVLVDAPHGYC